MEIDFWLGFQLCLSLACLLAAAGKDLVDRTIPNSVWLFYGGVAFVGAVLQFGVSVLLGVHLLFAVVMSTVYFVLWTRFMKYLGGADVKAIMALSISVSYLAIITITFSALLALVYLFYMSIRFRLTKKEIMALKAPYIPFLFLGFVLAVVYYAAV